MTEVSNSYLLRNYLSHHMYQTACLVQVKYQLFNSYFEYNGDSLPDTDFYTALECCTPIPLCTECSTLVSLCMCQGLHSVSPYRTNLGDQPTSYRPLGPSIMSLERLVDPWKIY